ncbi:hypothetical protein C2G38_1236452 [Gigaspora rosea]|uniref:Uncharacterized protein n=1 Tax=Gigaspora rosea TaxID=44941 RepID=A0A397W6B6_9GLOM|nr:hypothetical protein C2G38_1236452 [Gigaspora rosea]
MMIPRQKKQFLFFDEFVQTFSLNAIRWTILVNYLLALAIFVSFNVYDYKVKKILYEQNNNTTQCIPYGYDCTLQIFGDFCWYTYAVFFSLTLLCTYYIIFRFSWKWQHLIPLFIFDIILTCINIPFNYPYLTKQVMGPDYTIISCNIELSDSWIYNFCSFFKILFKLAWSSLFVWFIKYLIYLLFILIIASKRIYRFLKLWIVYQYQYRKGLFLTWLKERKEKTRKNNEVTPKNVNFKDNVINNDVNDVKVVII